MAISECTNEDNMLMMARYPDKFFDLAIVDPPYGINASKMSLGKGGGLYREPRTYKMGDWDRNSPYPEYWQELIRVTKNRIVWGANHFISDIPYDSPCWIVWDKMNGGTDFADCELAYTSFETAVRIFRFKWMGMLQGNMANKQQRIHPTEKPYQLYYWLLQNYGEGKILDTHLGSGASRIAAYKLGFDFWGCEIDKDYFEAQEKRFKEAINEPLFQTQPERVQAKLL